MNVKKLKLVLDAIEGESVDLVINQNNIQYKGTDIKFKYHLHKADMEDDQQEYAIPEPVKFSRRY